MKNTLTYRRSQPFGTWTARQRTARAQRLERTSHRPRFNSQPIAIQLQTTGTTTTPTQTPPPQNSTTPTPAQPQAAPRPDDNLQDPDVPLDREGQSSLLPFVPNKHELHSLVNRLADLLGMTEEPPPAIGPEPIRSSDPIV